MSAHLFYVVGASGSGKDTLVNYARSKLATESRVAFAHRYITRPHDSGGENHISLSSEEFEARVASKLFAMHWYSHELSYGIGIEINQWLAKGISVVVNGSRGYLDNAFHHYPELLPVWINVSTDVLRDRLIHRGRESLEQIEKRLNRHRRLEQKFIGDDVINNNGPLKEGGDALVRLILQRAGVSSCE